MAGRRQHGGHILDGCVDLLRAVKDAQGLQPAATAPPRISLRGRQCKRVSCYRETVAGWSLMPMYLGKAQRGDMPVVYIALGGALAQQQQFVHDLQDWEDPV